MQVDELSHSLLNLIVPGVGLSQRAHGHGQADAVPPLRPAEPVQDNVAFSREALAAAQSLRCRDTQEATLGAATDELELVPEERARVAELRRRVHAVAARAAQEIAQA